MKHKMWLRRDGFQILFTNHKWLPEWNSTIETFGLQRNLLFHAITQRSYCSNIHLREPTNNTCIFFLK